MFGSSDHQARRAQHFRMPGNGITHAIDQSDSWSGGAQRYTATARGVAQRADDEATLIYRLRRLLSDTEVLSAMRSKARLLAQPHAAQRILQHVRDQLPAAMF